MVSVKIVALTLLSAIGVHAAVHEVKVGAGGLVFDPPQLTGVAAGDDVSFVFQAKNHTVTQSSFALPCKAKENGVNSGFMLTPPDVQAKPTWTITIDNPAEPLWFYCRQKTPADHCAAGMVFSLNPTAEKSHEAFVAAAKAAAPAAGAPSASAGAATPSGSAAPGTDANAQPQAALSSNGAGALTTGSLASALAVLGVISAIL